MRENQSLDAARVKVYAKIKPPTQEELYATFANTQRGIPSARFLSPRDSKAKTPLSMPLSLLDDFPLSFYTFDASDSKKVFYFPNPISKRMLDETLYSENNSDPRRDSVFSSSRAFEFDRVFSINDT